MNAIFLPLGLGAGEISSQSPEVIRVSGSLPGIYPKRWAYPSSSKEKMASSCEFFGIKGTKSSVAVAVASIMSMISGVEVTCGVQPRTASKMMHRIAMSADKRRDVFGMEILLIRVRLRHILRRLHIKCKCLG